MGSILVTDKDGNKDANAAIIIENRDINKIDFALISLGISFNK